MYGNSHFQIALEMRLIVGFVRRMEYNVHFVNDVSLNGTSHFGCRHG